MSSGGNIWSFFRRKTVIVSVCTISFAVLIIHFYVWQDGGDRSSVKVPPSFVLPDAHDEPTWTIEPERPPEPSKPASEIEPTPPPQIVAEEPLRNVALRVFDDTAVRELCATAPWDSGADLVVNCEGRVGGIGNVRQEVLQCVRLAIEVGAGLIRPSMRIRSEGLIEYQSGPLIGFEYFFDTASFEDRLKSACPRMPLYPNLEAVEAVGNIERVGRPWFLPDDENGQRMSFASWTDENRFTDGNITVIDLPLTMGQGQVCEDGAAFVDNFGGLVDFREDTQILTLNALSALSRRFESPKLASLGLNDSLFIGVHLRTAADAINAGYASYETQAAQYLNIIRRRGATVVYAASGNETSLEQLTQDAAALSPPATVVTKRNLLSLEDLAILDNLTWDQQAIIDFLILQKSSYFAGITESSFAWGIAYARQVISENGTCGAEVEVLPEGVLYEDELSIIYGEDRDFFWGKVWP